ncbi:hypothetical protein CRYUN_Cryun25bG0029800 [Craigia yunnanensis]
MAATSVTAPWLLRGAFQALPFSQPLYPINTKLSFYGNLCSFPVQNPLRSSGLCHIAQVIKGDNDVLLKGVGDKSAIEEVKHILEKGEKGAHILIVPELVEFLMLTLDKVANVSVSCTQIPLLTLEYEPPRTQSFKTVEASLRVDALASAGFKISRSKLVNLFSNGDVRVNWSNCYQKWNNSQDWRYCFGDGRIRNPDEKPLVVPEAPVPSETETIPKPSVRQPKEEAKSSPQPDTKLPKKVQKDAETKREKKAKKAAASTAAANPELPTEAVADASEPEKVDDVNADAPVPAPFSLKDKVQKENIIRYRNRTKGSESLPRAILKRKKSINYWIWAASAALVVLILLALGYYYLV